MFDDTTKLSILTHETGHAILHNGKELMKTEYSEAQMEFEADATSVMLQTYFGVEISESRLRHLSECYNEMLSNKNTTSKDVVKSLDRAHKAFKTVVDNVNQQMRREFENAQILNNQDNTQQTLTQTSTTENHILPSQIHDIDFGGFSFEM